MVYFKPPIKNCAECFSSPMRHIQARILREGIRYEVRHFPCDLHFPHEDSSLDPETHDLELKFCFSFKNFYQPELTESAPI